MSLSPQTRERIASLVESNSVMLFMKGSPDAPQCGFSAQVVQILGHLLPRYATFDVLQDPEVRDGIKDFSDWPTIPQLYIRGEFVGGCDIIQEMYANGELRQALGLPPPPSTPPRIAVTPAARELLQAARARAEGADLHLSIDARFESALGLGPRQPGEIAVAADEVTLLLDPESAGRAEGLTIDAVETDAGRRLRVDNPNAPKSGEAPRS